MVPSIKTWTRLGPLLGPRDLFHSKHEVVELLSSKRLAFSRLAQRCIVR